MTCQVYKNQENMPYQLTIFIHASSIKSFRIAFRLETKVLFRKKLAEGLYPAEAIPKDWDHPGSAIHF